LIVCIHIEKIKKSAAKVRRIFEISKFFGMFENYVLKHIFKTSRRFGGSLFQAFHVIKQQVEKNRRYQRDEDFQYFDHLFTNFKILLG